MKAVLVLEDGSVWPGEGFGSFAKVSGEVVFNTGMVGYPESITDPSYHGQILCQTYPLIGNYGVSSKSFESDKPKIQGYVVSEHCEAPSHASSEKSLDVWFKENSIPGIAGLDTRALTKKLRLHGVMLGILETYYTKVDLAALRREARLIPDPNKRHLVGEMTVKKIKVYNRDGAKTVVLIDCGAKLNILQSLLRRGLKVVRVPDDTPAAKILEYAPDGLFISNGPGDPKKCAATIETLRFFLQGRIPIFGICLGHQLLSLAAGADTYKLKFGHRSQNQPCLEEGTKRCYITSQNHGYAVDVRALPKDWHPWFTNANDDTNEGVRHISKPFFSVQFHPEAAPGPTDTDFLFDRFCGMLG
ncbi:MAG: glutamine-hydrolyzing carbamoyl-phosphate synthase small subunit [Candidatus Aminicenantes bacterium]|nr:glutamine-hydrolyzing carbamoyl-phosphate synthase small subunit [Candidatus Aminicenantes bacterium]